MNEPMRMTEVLEWIQENPTIVYNYVVDREEELEAIREVLGAPSPDRLVDIMEPDVYRKRFTRALRQHQATIDTPD